MSYDLAFRYSQALDPSALVMIGTTLHAIHAAITDCRNAGLDLESDPAIILLARHLGTVCAGQPSQAARPLPTRYAGTAISLNGEPIQNRVSDPTSRITIAGNEVRIDTGCGVVSAVIRREREGLSLISNASSSDGSACTGARLTVHNQVMRLVNGPAAGIVDVNGDLLLAGEGVWLTARSN
ncbi:MULTISPECIES: hypothetical protein [Sphingomonadaceae]|uniref:hypothetical protein n=1 Tax=Sphingomonadales TaxID=204457 RepID=UPI00082982A5|nr:hypothetical protein [Sphingopyxis granuli]MCF8710281.1 hypothetical protein [Rhizorhapis sp. SPR117]